MRILYTVVARITYSRDHSIAYASHCINIIILALTQSDASHSTEFPLIRRRFTASNQNKHFLWSKLVKCMLCFIYLHLNGIGIVVVNENKNKIFLLMISTGEFHLYCFTTMLYFCQASRIKRMKNINNIQITIGCVQFNVAHNNNNNINGKKHRTVAIHNKTFGINTNKKKETFFNTTLTNNSKEHKLI